MHQELGTHAMFLTRFVTGGLDLVALVDKLDVNYSKFAGWFLNTALLIHYMQQSFRQVLSRSMFITCQNVHDYTRQCSLWKLRL